MAAMKLGALTISSGWSRTWDPAYAVLQHLGLKVRPQGPARDPFENTGGFGEAQVGSIERAHAHLQPKDTSVASCRFMALEYAPGTSPATPIRPRIVNCPRKRVNHISITPPDLDAATQAGWMCWVPSRSTKSPSRTSWSVCFQVGDMIVELLRPGPYSSLADAETGAVAFVRARGFRAFDPELGPQVDTLVTSLQAKETAGLRFSLFQRL